MTYSIAHPSDKYPRRRQNNDSAREKLAPTLDDNSLPTSRLPKPPKIKNTKSPAEINPPKQKKTYNKSNLYGTVRNTENRERKLEYEKLLQQVNESIKTGSYVLGSKVFYFSIDIHNRLFSIHKFHRSSVGRYLEDNVDKLFNLVLGSNSIWNKNRKIEMLQEADVVLGIIKLHVRRLFLFKLITMDAYNYLCDVMDEIGSILGGYINNKARDAIDREKKEQEKLLMKEMTKGTRVKRL